MIEAQSWSFIPMSDGWALTLNNFIMKYRKYLDPSWATEEERAVVEKVLVIPVQVLGLHLQVLRGVPVAQPHGLLSWGDQDNLPVVGPGLGGGAAAQVGQVGVQSGHQLRHQSGHLVSHSAHTTQSAS